MPSISHLLQQALLHQQAGNHAVAEQNYRAVLSHDADHAEAWHLLGVLLSQHGDSAHGLECIQKAVDLEPRNPMYHSNAGVLLRMQGRTAESIESYRRAISLQPTFADAHNNLANLLAAEGFAEEAFTHYQKAIWLKDRFAEAYFGIGRLLAAKGRRDEATGYCRAAVDIKPDMADAHDMLAEILISQCRWNEARQAAHETLRVRPDSAIAHFRLATILQAQGKLLQATQSYRLALAAQPEFVHAHCQLAGILLQQRQLPEAISYYEGALKLDPLLPEAHCGLGAARTQQGHYEDAAVHFERALELRSDYTQALNNLAAVSVLLGRRVAAHACYERLLLLQPDHYDAHCDRSMLLLSEGRFAEGWREYEWRWKRPDVRGARYAGARWTGQPLPDETILIHTEQGFGDTLQFIRYAALVKQRVGRVVVECAPALAGLLTRCSWIDKVVVRGTALPSFDVHAPLMSLPGVFGTLVETIPADVPYLTPDAGLVADWQKLLSAASPLRVGINWQGSTTHVLDHLRSFPLEQLAPLADVPGVQLYSLQVGAGREQLQPLEQQMRIIDLADHLGDFHKTAAALMHLDLVITCDSAIGHLAGSIGKPVWLLIASAADWRWLHDREDSPWYPTSRLFRQNQSGNWAEVVDQVVRALRNFTS